MFENLAEDGRKYKFRDMFSVKYGEDVCRREVDVKHRRVVMRGFLTEQPGGPHMVKTFYHSRGFIETDQGNHHGRVVHDNTHAIDSATGSNISHSYIASDVSLLHFSVPSYNTMSAKILRGAAGYGYTDRTNCSAVGPGRHYCETAKEFRKQSPLSQAHFMLQCLAPATGKPDTLQWRDWFARNTLTIEQIIGEVVQYETHDFSSQEDVSVREPSVVTWHELWMQVVENIVNLFAKR